MNNFSLRQRMVLIVSLICFVLFSSSYFYSSYTISKSFLEHEEEDASDNLSRVSDSLLSSGQIVISKLSDWAQWDDAYQYLKDKNKKFEKSNLQINIVSLKLDHLSFWSLNKNFVWGSNIDFKTRDDSKKLFPILKKDLETIQSVANFHHSKDYLDKKYIFVNLVNGPYLLVSVPVTSTDGKSPIAGYIIGGVKLDPEFFLKLSKDLHIPIVSKNLQQDSISNEESKIIKKLKTNKFQIETTNPTTLKAFGVLRDHNGMDLLLYKLSMPRDILHQSQKVLKIFLITMILSGIILVIAMLISINKLVISKLLKLTEVMDKVKESGDLKQNVPDLGKDEIGLLGESFNVMINEIERLRTSSIHNEKMASLGEMAGGIAHEINNPLDIISGKIENIQSKILNKKLTDEYLSRSLEVISDTVERASKIVRGLRIIARTADTDPFVPKDVAELINETLPYCEDKLKKAGIKLILENKISCNINCREVQISQVIINLLGNSVDALENFSEKWIEIKTEIVNDRLRLSITDSGNGISKEISEKIMMPFFTTKEVGKGTGLGLSVSKGIIEAHGGTITLNHNLSNTQFIIELPVFGNVAL